ncbi:Pcl1 protein [Martiniozyma asiatica (nom. inval.)]|nr:Pcl1 protein [Martiniozyma asiatica]
MSTTIDEQAMEIFLNSPVTQDMIHHLVSVTLQVLPCASSKTVTQEYPSPTNSPNKSFTKVQPLPSLMTFITKLVRYTNVYTGTLMATILYLNRLKSRLPKDAKGLPCTRHRIFLACLIISSKNFNDSSPKNRHWSKYTDGLFRKEDVNLMEKQLLMLLDWDVSTTEIELRQVWSRWLEPIKEDIRKGGLRSSISKGMLMGSTQTIVVAEKVKEPYNKLHTRSESVSSVSTISSINSMHSRNSSISSIGSYTPAIDSVNATLEDALATLSSKPLNDYLKCMAMKEERELDQLLREYVGN